MSENSLSDRCEIALPYSKRVVLRDVTFDSGMKMTRLVFFEGKRVTQVDLDDDSARALAAALVSGLET